MKTEMVSKVLSFSPFFAMVCDDPAVVGVGSRIINKIYMGRGVGEKRLTV